MPTANNMITRNSSIQGHEYSGDVEKVPHKWEMYSHAFFLS